MDTKNLFSTLKVKQLPEAFSFPPIYRKHFDLIMKAHAFQCDKHKGEIEFADFFGAVAESTLLDPEYAKICPEYSPLEHISKSSRCGIRKPKRKRKQ